MKPTPVAAIPFVAVLLWVATLIADPGPYSPGSVALIGVGWLILSTVATVGLVVVGARWARWTLIWVLASTLLVAILRPLDWLALAGLASTAGGLVALLAPARALVTRRLPAAAGPPEKSVLLMIGGLAAPAALGLLPVATNTWVLVFSAIPPVLVFLYGRTVAGGLVAVRYLLPATAFGTALGMPWQHAVTTVVITSVLTILAWSKDVSVAFRPDVRLGTSYPIPPELVPDEIREGARIDDRGRPS